MLDLQGTATTIKRRNKNKRMKCAFCGEGIKLRKEWTNNNDRQPVHTVCAAVRAAEQKSEPTLTLASCPTCFIVAPCFCVGT